MYKNLELQYYDPDLTAVAATLVGLPKAESPEHRKRILYTRELLLKQATCSGLMDYLEANPSNWDSREFSRLRVRLLAIGQRFSAEALALMLDNLGEKTTTDEVPF